jgi:REP element-mobilizing transposase RayT
MPQSVASLHVHLVFSTREREPWISAELAPRLYEYIGAIVRAHNSRLIAAGGMPDHVHLLVSFGRELAVADAVRLVKSNSSKWLHESNPDLYQFAWQAGYGAFAVSYSHVERVRGYILRQEEHHRGRTYQEEFRALLRKHRIEYDERYIWD